MLVANASSQENGVSDVNSMICAVFVSDKWLIVSGNETLFTTFVFEAIVEL